MAIEVGAEACGVYGGDVKLLNSQTWKIGM